MSSKRARVGQVPEDYEVDRFKPIFTQLSILESFDRAVQQLLFGNPVSKLTRPNLPALRVRFRSRDTGREMRVKAPAYWFKDYIELPLDLVQEVVWRVQDLYDGTPKAGLIDIETMEGERLGSIDVYRPEIESDDSEDSAHTYSRNRYMWAHSSVTADVLDANGQWQKEYFIAEL